VTSPARSTSRTRRLIARIWPTAVALLLIALVLALPEWRLSADGEAPVEAARGHVVDVRGPVDPDDPLTVPVDPLDDPALGGDLLVLVLDGPREGEHVWAWLGFVSTEASIEDFAPGDEVVVTFTGQPDGLPFVAVSERWRLPELAVLALAFVLAVVVIGRWQGLRALIALSLTAVLVVRVLIPLVLDGAPPVPVAIAVAALVTVVTIALTEGPSRSSLAAILGTIGSLVVTGVVSAVVSDAARFTGAGADELVFLQIAPGVEFDVRGLLLAAFILGAVGVLDDVTVTQASAVRELSARRGLRGAELWVSAMRVGRSHIAATVNTLFLAYVGASLPLLVLFTLAAQPTLLTVNSEVVAVEVVRTLAGSLGIVAAVPLTTALATLLVSAHERDADASAGLAA
jgi:uncharacterized membrane protein